MSKLILANDGIDAIGKSLLEKAGFTVVTEKVAQENLATEINAKGYIAPQRFVKMLLTLVRI